MLEMLAAGAIAVALILYALSAGADFGGGIWDLFARGPRAEARRGIIADAIGPIWEADHVWLILVVVILFTGFPVAFAAIMVALNVPITLMLLGIVLRGTSFVFRKHSSKQGGGHRRWSMVFGAASCFTPFVQGMTLAALGSGEIRIAGGVVTSGLWAGWLSPFALACGLFALLLFAFLAAVYLTVDSSESPAVQEDFRLRAIGSCIGLLITAALVFGLARSGAPVLFEGLTRWWSPWLVGVTGLTAVMVLGSLWHRRFQVARTAAVMMVGLILAGWCLAQFPDLVVPDLTIAAAAAPTITLQLLLGALLAGCLILFPSLYVLFRLFKGEGSHQALQPPAS